MTTLAMAGKTKRSNDLSYSTEEISKELRQLQDDIMEMTEISKQRRETVEKHCGQCRDLFKPWPSRVVQLYSQWGRTHEELNAKDENPSCGVSNPEVEKEEQELAMLDEILAKAQHARDIQNKMSKPSSKKCPSAKSKSSNLSTSQVKETKPKPKVSYPVLKRPASAKSTYASSYTKPTVKNKLLETGTKKTSSANREIVASQHKLKKKPDQGKPTEIKSRNPRCENLVSGKPAQRSTESKLPSEPQPGQSTNSEPSNTKTTVHSKFLISEKGSTLTMPMEFREICKEHKKLVRRVRKAKTFRKTESEDQFVKKVEELFCPTLHSMPSFFELEEDGCELEKKYKELLGFTKVNFKVSGIECDQSSSRLEDLEAVIAKFEQLNKEVQVLNERRKFLNKHCPFHEHRSVFFGGQGERLDVKLPSSFWEPKYSKTDMDGYFTYHNMKELRTLLKLSFDYKIMKYQLDLRKMLADAILPLLQQMPTSHKSFVPLCRAVYSILCCEGKAFPTVVKDSSLED